MTPSARVVAEGVALIGKVHYVWGAKTPDEGISDCSGFITYCFHYGAGLDIGLGTYDQLRYCQEHGVRIAGEPQPADIIFLDWDGQAPGTPSHVAIVEDSEHVIECTKRLDPVRGQLNGVVRTAIAGSIWEGPQVNGWRIL